MPPSIPQNADHESKHNAYQQHPPKIKTLNSLAKSVRSLFRGTAHSKQFYPSVTPQDSDDDVRLHNEPDYSDLPSETLQLCSRRGIEQTVAATFRDAHHFSIGGNARIVTIGQQHVNSQGICGLDNLKEFVSFSAFHDSSAQDPERCCHLGTRKNVLDKMRTWTDDPNAPEHILWLHGPAGVGKSAIAQTISYSYGRDKVGASFFFFRSDPARNDGNRLFPTLAWRLASSVPIVKDLIASSLEEDPDLPRKAIEAQFNQLIAQPFLTISGGESAAPTPSRVVIIDGLDECSDVKLQRRILKIIGNAVANTHLPLRFVISSRPEAHIEDFFAQFQYPTLQIDLANIEGAYRDIETYLASEFARIAVEQELDYEVWPGQAIIDACVSKSSGQFVYASTVMKYVGDENESAVAQLNVILGLRPSTGKSPFSELDVLYTEILQRQQDKIFLKDFLAVLVARITLAGKFPHGKFHEDDAMLLGLDKKQLHRKLRGMRSLLKSKPFIDVHHKSFLDFLQDPSRSGEYHVSNHRRYMELITDVLVKAASKAMDQADSHEGDHFKPIFGIVTRRFPLDLEIPFNDLEEILQPLLVIQEQLLQLPNMSVPWKPRACDECWTFYMIDDLVLRLAWFRAIHLQEPKYVGIRPLTAMDERQSIPQLDLDTCLSLLLGNLRGVESQLSLNMETISLVRALVSFDPTEIAMKVRSITDAQNLIDLIFCLRKNDCFNSWFGARASVATRLALEIYGRVPLPARSLSLNSEDFDKVKREYQGKAVKTGYDIHVVWGYINALVWASLSHSSVAPLLGLFDAAEHIEVVYPCPENGTLREWRQKTNPSVSNIQQIALEVAKLIQYMHSLGLIVYFMASVNEIYFDSDFHLKVPCGSFPSRYCQNGDYINRSGFQLSLNDDTFRFGLLFYEVLFNTEIYSLHRFWCNTAPVMSRPSEPEIQDDVWQLIQRCCAEDANERPTMDQVVQEMESWVSNNQSLSS